MKHPKPEKDPDVRLVVNNRKARHLYHIEQTWEAGLVLHGTEVKSLRQGGGSLNDNCYADDRVQQDAAQGTAIAEKAEGDAAVADMGDGEAWHHLDPRGRVHGLHVLHDGQLADAIKEHNDGGGEPWQESLHVQSSR